jgi:glyoxylase-like metal-dependent hydrolase (beta-lactamase superfamily II)
MHSTKTVTRLALLAGLGSLATGLFAQQAPAPVKATPLSGGAYWVTGGAGANTGFIVGTNGVIVIDSKMTADSTKAMLAQIAAVTPKPVTHVILTHSDPDHVNGLTAFPKGLVIVAHENCRKEMAEALNAAPPAMAPLRDYLPTQTVAGNEDLTIDGVHLRLLHFAPGHTSGDLMVYLPDQKIVFAGDILTMQFPYPLVHREKQGTSEGLIANMKGMLALNAETFVPGHGALQARPALEKRLADTEARRAEVAKLFNEGKSLDQVKQSFHESTTPQGGGAVAGRFNPPTFTEVVYREVSAGRPFDVHDLSGFWEARGATNFAISRTAPPMTAWAQAKYDAAKPGLGPRGKPLGNDPIMICDPMGYPRIIVASGGYGVQIVQAPKEMLMLFDWFYARRDIWTDGRKLQEDPEPRFYGNSVGHWDGDTFVVESNGFDERTWLDDDGHPHSDEMRLEERYHRVDHDTIELTMTVTDPKAYTQPWVSEKKFLEWFPAADLEARGSGWNDLREDSCIPSVEAKYKDLVREPAGRAGAPAH